MSHIVEQGTGRDLVLVHGVGLDHTMWDFVVDALAIEHRVIRYDLLGHGATADPPGPRHLDDFVAQLTDVLDRTGARAPAIIGLSIGAMIALRFATQHPGRASQLVIANGVYDPDEDHLAGYAQRLAAVEAASMEVVVEPAMQRWFTDAWRAEHSDRVDALATMLRDTDHGAYVKAYRTFVGSHHLLTGTLGAIRQPTLVITGELDVGSTPAMTTRMAELIDDASAVVLPGLHHVPPWEDATAFLEPVQSFLEG